MKKLVLGRRRCYFFISRFTVITLLLFVSIILFFVITKSMINKVNIAKIALLNTNSYLKDNKKQNIVRDAVMFLTSVDLKDPKSIIENTYKGLIKPSIELKEEVSLPKIYIYNTHQGEEYASSNLAEYNVSPKVGLANNILREKLFDLGISSLIEERSISKVLKENSWPYSYSYKVSRTYLEDIKEKNPSLNLFVDIHRDSVGRDITYKKINEKDYARILFIIGLENPRYQENLKLTEQIKNDLENYAPGITRGIYKKEGKGVDGVYNQDVSPKVILVEMGGNENTINEVYNSTELLAKVLYNYLGDEK